VFLQGAAPPSAVSTITLGSTNDSQASELRSLAPGANLVSLAYVVVVDDTPLLDGHLYWTTGTY